MPQHRQVYAFVLIVRLNDNKRVAVRVFQREETWNLSDEVSSSHNRGCGQRIVHRGRNGIAGIGCRPAIWTEHYNDPRLPAARGQNGTCPRTRLSPSTTDP